MRLPVDRFLPFAALALLSACGGNGHSRVASAPAPSGPAADYPVVLGEPFTIDGVTYTPADKLNSDQVGYAVAGAEGGSAVSAAHRTLPLPSYVEVTSLETGKTILVRVERRGPPTGDALVELSPGAAAQLGAGARTAVRVRRVNPPEIERAALRSGERAPERMDTPKSLLAVLMRKLDPRATAPVSAAATKPATLAAIASAPKPRAAVAAVKPEPAPAPVATERPPARMMIQVGAFGSKTNAEATAARVGGTVSQSGRLWRVRMGPYQARSEVAAALAKARGAGYIDPRIHRAE
jgi:rare lipoprotein A